MKLIKKRGKSVDLEDLENKLRNLNPETYPDYTADWPDEELKDAIQEGLESGDSGVSSLSEYRKAFARNKD